MRTIEAIKHPLFGTQVALASALGIGQPTVSEWGEYPPALYQLRIEAMTGLRAEPDAAGKYPELAAAIRAAGRLSRKTRPACA
jgi:hypothetical protein